ncbi:hypothetical protein A3E39_04715 [Candidatus Uhrbacteria bacterium RIFCSPHIGHO2_12_FULL_60_25]|uniref:Uncharacterized protein n=1 Tax=Candidatus Uhrbacteria bacterium RIFCSPHIGHO2_12_FULL_60_25 TaxID=1802399 RepID=A0A1F7UKV9_9BACT|nr:MAG: hypothetical protein A3D73_04060 [Candidatus Uhrbacteria bacterium RIFCSPHIGHO2_02_FULL_60_44]OGL78337.1 MAG: hypothetical protein A3E39_04715 [Candidatus Uhrbacteria bacterium RIFCSPHIGHO2_12_FULL_60_25]
MPLNALSKGEDHETPKVAQYDRGKVQQLIRALTPPKAELPPEGSRITVHAAVSRFSVLYERIRTAVEYKEDHLLRKGAILRILKRQIILENDPHVIANNLVRELIAARYLPNATLPESLIDDATARVRKYQAVAKSKAGGERHLNWVLGIISAELEETLVDATREKALVTFLYEQLSDRIQVKGAKLDETERRLQIYVACYRSLVKADEDTVGYKLLRAYLPEWNRPDEWLDAPRATAERLEAVQHRVQERIRHPLSQRFLRAVKPWAVSFSLLIEAALEEKERGELLQSREDVHEAVKRVTLRGEREARARLRRGTVRAMIYLFVTKMVFALVLELPIEWLWYHDVSMTALAINLSFPPVLMFFVGILIRPPGADNRTRILRSVDELLVAGGIPTLEIRVPRLRSGFTLFFMRIIYTLTFGISFGLVGFGLWLMDFTWVATVIFFFFLCIVSFFGYRLRQSAREIVVVQPKERLITTLTDFLFLPILRAGQWLSVTISRLNIFVFLFDFLFEAPFKLFLNVLEDWLSFMKEKKEELSEE